MASRITCDVCGASAEGGIFQRGWGSFNGFDPNNEHSHKDCCPRCSVVLGNLIVELKKHFAGVQIVTTTGAPAPEPGNIGVEALVKK